MKRLGLVALALLLPGLVWAQGMSATEGHRLAVAALGHDARAYLRLDTAAHAGDAVAMNWLGAYWESRGDAGRAVHDYRLSAAAGNRTAALNLGYLYDFGHGVRPDPARALGWYRRAARLGSVHALAELGNAYYLGKGVARDVDRAYAWYWLAGRRSAAWRPVAASLAAEIGAPAARQARAMARGWLAGGASS